MLLLLVPSVDILGRERQALLGAEFVQFGVGDDVSQLAVDPHVHPVFILVPSAHLSLELGDQPLVDLAVEELLRRAHFQVQCGNLVG